MQGMYLADCGPLAETAANLSCVALAGEKKIQIVWSGFSEQMETFLVDGAWSGNFEVEARDGDVLEEVEVWHLNVWVQVTCGWAVERG